MNKYNIKLTVVAPSNFDADGVIEYIEELLEEDEDLQYSTCNEFLYKENSIYFIDFEVFAPDNFDDKGVIWAVEQCIQDSGDFVFEKDSIVVELIE